MPIRSALDALPTFHAHIAKWYAKCGRVELPWRNLARDGSQSYEVYISEIMLQQTQVSRVLEEFYFPFLRTFPTLTALAESSEQEVLRLWQGLGYYTRARNLRKCAQICVEKHGGALPRGVENLQKLPGIGSYSAGAISCFGFGESVGFVDANIRRVFSRLFALANPTHAELQNLATKLLDTNDSFSYNQALLDIGALVCKPKPLCLVCPIREFCQGSHAPQNYPQKVSKPRESLHLALFAIDFCESDISYIALTAPQQDSLSLDSPHSTHHTQLYAGLYNLPMIPTPLLKSHALNPLTLIGHYKHAYTKYNITTQLWHTRCTDESMARALLDSLLHNSSQYSAQKPIAFVPIHTLPTLPLSSLSHKALKILHANPML